MPKTAEHYETRAKIMKALAHPSRLMMVEALSHGEQCVCELTSLVGHDISTVSKHLKILKEANIVEDERRGKQAYYRLKIPCVMNFFNCMGSILAQDLK
ncbi:transcriptional regulator, ArsR family [Oleidesulfovibrio alaskensis G20]|uniref:Transcriptional regulator, ArsR family n=1 Tax=Oleidesulfovibrio alaskensis (strain ATCC BAA-1058 / DSM 17464 / G20) TaxID=207559 RepID=Q30XM4_OLEA2|nr:metalloregulator ArsR/SmtB family transcription factor [Oleidesulfovibrio alaskensis]ABB39572.2 transcriptional regulator, ArsR family [Oleidesulfovibrio alaskensis G20]